jgi:DNA polymerase elongation subunit (family B)
VDDGPKVLFLDIETTPNVAYSFETYKAYISPEKIIIPTRVLCFAAKWADSKTKFYAGAPLGSHQTMVEAAHDLLDEADIVVHYNGTKFDIPHLNREFLTLGLTPPSPFRQVDLYRTVAKVFKFPSGKLAHVAEVLLNNRKVEHEGFSLWDKCMGGDEDAWKRMKKYNMQDVKLTEQLYYVLQPWIANHPNLAAFAGGRDCCPQCGSEQIHYRGTLVTGQSRYRRFQCRVCGRYSRSTKSVDRAQIVPVPL